MCHRKFFRRLGPFDCLEQFINSTCGKYVVEMFNFAFVSKIKFPFQKQFSQEILLGFVEKIS